VVSFGWWGNHKPPRMRAYTPKGSDLGQVVPKLSPDEYLAKSQVDSRADRHFGAGDAVLPQLLRPGGHVEQGPVAQFEFTLNLVIALEAHLEQAFGSEADAHDLGAWTEQGFVVGVPTDPVLYSAMSRISFTRSGICAGSSVKPEYVYGIGAYHLVRRGC